MRIYSMKSGRNNMSRLLARSIMYNSPKKKSVKVQPTTTESFWIYLIVFIIIALIFFR